MLLRVDYRKVIRRITYGHSQIDTLIILQSLSCSDSVILSLLFSRRIQCILLISFIQINSLYWKILGRRKGFILQQKIYLENMSEKQNFPVLNKAKINQNSSKKSLLRVNKQLPSVKSLKEKSMRNIAAETPVHPAEKYLYGSKVSLCQFKKFATLLYQGLFYSTCSLKGPSQQYLRRKSVRLPETKESKRKFLILDLDQTLIHSVWDQEPSEVSIGGDQEQIRFNIRPHCLSFLERISAYFEVFVFTASTEDYAEKIVGHLNSKKKTIQGVLSRSHCLQTHNGLRIKDLRIIKNRSLADIVIIDNLVHSFGLQIDNGIPILDYTDSKEDRQLLGIQKILMELRNVEDVRDFIRSRVALRKCLEINEDEFLSFSGKRMGKKG